MDRLFEQKIAQNPALGAWALWEAVRAFEKASAANANGLPLTHSLLVLPIVLHRRSAEAIHRKQMTEGSVYRVVTDSRLIAAGLQSRVVTLADLTFRSVNVATAAGLLVLDRSEAPALASRRKTMPTEVTALTFDESVTAVLHASRRVGYWVATTDFSLLCRLLRVRF